MRGIGVGPGARGPSWALGPTVPDIILFVWLIIYEPLEIEVVPVLHRIYAIADEDGEGYPGDFLPDRQRRDFPIG
ncbi:hypothetical protein ACPCK2_32840 [Streptomyces pseudogriseolus]|uniref:hypothetical protein n=1 Tax=Streptomyces pseudogriseolus TaxID=36817 RepID=UPI003FA2A562